eukprot:SM000352S13428  [mRNA]  locus=s352:43307:48636:- [translate_table: standard]
MWSCCSISWLPIRPPSVYLCPCSLQTTRRDALRLASGVLGLSSLYFTATHLKALSYVSPRAILNAVLGGTQLPARQPGQVAGEGRIADLTHYIADLEKRGGGRRVPEFQSNLQWLNSPPLQLGRELRGKVVILDFWTYCCINCMHVLPDLAYIERKYEGQPVAVVGVHSAKFDNEKDLNAIRNAVLRYEIRHPVVNDGEMTMWHALGVSSWPTLALVSPSGKLLGMLAGEGHRKDLDELLQAALAVYGPRGELQPGPLPVTLEKDRDSRLVATPLSFPGKIASDLANGRLFISDSNHHRIVVTDLEGNFIAQVGGKGGEGFTGGPFAEAAFNRPQACAFSCWCQGLAYDSSRNVLYVADTENHALREVNLVTETVRTLAGDGSKGQDYQGGRSGALQELNSPWDVAVLPGSGKVFVAMAGQHQIWTCSMTDGTCRSFSGDGYERNLNGSRGAKVSYAQPSGISIAPGGTEMYVADSESSSVRVVNLDTGGALLCAGGDPNFAENLFQFGDRDGTGARAQLQHPLGVLYGEDGRLYVADSYNHKVKVMDVSSKEMTTLAGTGTAGFRDGGGSQAQFSEPAGLAQGPRGTIFVADTNNSIIRVLDPTRGNEISTLNLASVPVPQAEATTPASKGGPRRLRGRRAAVDTVVVQGQPLPVGQDGQLHITVSIPEGYHFTKGAVSKFDADIDAPSKGAVRLDPSSGPLQVEGLNASTTVSFGSFSAATVQISCKVYYCQEDEVCLYEAVTFEVPFQEGASAPTALPVELKHVVVPKAVNTSSLTTV